MAFAQDDLNDVISGNADTSSKSKLVFSEIDISPVLDACKLVMGEAYARLGYEADVVPYPAGRSTLLANSGVVDGEALRTQAIEKDNPNLVRVPFPLFHMDLIIVVKYGDVDMNRGWEALKGKRIGLLSGTRHAFLDKLQGPTVRTPNPQRLIELLEDARIDVILVSRCVAHNMLNRWGMEGMHILEPPLARIPVYHYLHKKHGHLAPEINLVFQEMATEGFFKEVRRKLTPPIPDRQD